MKKLFSLSFIFLTIVTTFMFGAMVGNAADLDPMVTGGVISGLMASAHAVSFLVGQPIFPANSLAIGCGTITGNILFDCNKPPQAGTRDIMWLIDLDVWDDPATVKTPNATNAMVLETITLPVGASAYKIEGRNNSNAPSSTMVEGTYIDQFDHALNFVGFDLSNAAMKIYQDMVGGKYVAIVEHNFKGTAGQSAFKVYGADAGMKLRTFVIDPNNADTGGAASFGLASTDTSKEPKIPLSVFDTSYATTKTMIEALVS